jgi:nicotinamidase/pyrazinamidase
MKTIYWNVDTQYDFMRNNASFHGALPVPGAKDIESNLEKLTKHAESKDITVVNTADWHTPKSEEISDTPDFATTFPPHCIQGTLGAEYIPETRPKDSLTIDWQDDYFMAPLDHMLPRNIIIYKDRFDAFHPKGSPHTENVLRIFNPDKAYVYGVATNVCVDYAVKGLLLRGIEVYVVKDAIKELPGDVQPIYARWKELGAKFTTTDEVVAHED